MTARLEDYFRVMEKESSRNALISAGFAVATAPMAAGLTALVWQFPIAVAGTGGRSVGAAYAAAITMVAFMTLFSVFAGIVAIGLVGAGVGFLARARPPLVAAFAGIAVGVLAALIVAVTDVYLTG